MNRVLFFALIVMLSLPACAQKTTRADSLRGMLRPERTWWNALKYNLYVIPNHKNKSITGTNKIDFKAERSGITMQIDLQEPLQIKKIIFNNAPVTNIKKEGNAYFVTFNNMFVAGKEYSIVVHYEGQPVEAKNAPWDGGVVWTKDKKNRPWISTACQGKGASVWWPCKDHQSDEPENGTVITVESDAKLFTVSNGNLVQAKDKKNKTVETWQVTAPINNYGVCMNIGSYVNFKDTLQGEEGVLPLSYYVLDYNLETAKKHFNAQVKPMLRAMEYWFGPYPFYKDGFKLVETPFLGMEHQSAVAYGNKFMNGYLGTDLSGTGWGNKWDYIIVHETGHEWFGNNITTNDIADMWVHEGFTDYSEALYIEYYYGKKAATEYVIGLRSNITNDKPVIGPYNVNKEGSGDMYYKGANLIHTIRQIIDNETLFRGILRGLNKNFKHKTVTTQEIESYISRNAGRDFSKVFDQYLRTTKIPALVAVITNETLVYKWDNVVDGFNMPIRVTINDTVQWLKPTTTEQTLTGVKKFKKDEAFYVK
jgi:aminopeptidase N